MAPVLRFCHQNILVTYKKDLNGVQGTCDGAVIRVADKLDVAAHMCPHVKVLDGDVVPGVVTGVAAAYIEEAADRVCIGPRVL